MKEAILKKINNKLTELFGENVSQNVFDRVNEEIRFFEEKGLTDFIYNLSDYLKNLLETLGQNNAFHVRQEAGYSLVLYLLGINDLNPLPLYKHKHKEYGLLFDGYNLDFEIFKYKFESLKETLSLSYCKDSFDFEFNGHICHFIKDKLTSLTFGSNYEINPLYDYSIAPFYAFNANTDGDITPLLDKYTQELLIRFENCGEFEDLVKIIALSHGQQVIEANEKIGRFDLDSMIVSIDDLYHTLTKTIDKELAISICKIACSNQKVPDETELMLLAKGVERDFINFVNECRFLYTRGGAISIARSIVKLMYIRMRDEDANKAIHL